MVTTEGMPAAWMPTGISWLKPWYKSILFFFKSLTTPRLRQAERNKLNGKCVGVIILKLFSTLAKLVVSFGAKRLVAVAANILCKRHTRKTFAVYRN